MRPRSEIAFRQLYDRHHRAVFAYFLRRTDRESALEGTEEVFLVVWRRFEDVPEGDRELPWLYGVARRVLANQRRGAARHTRLVKRLFGLGTSSPAEPDAQVIRRLEEQEVLEALDRLPLRDREIVRLAYWEELPHADIGLLVGCSAGAVDVRLHRALRKIEKGLRSPGHRSSGRQLTSRRKEQP